MVSLIFLVWRKIVNAAAWYPNEFQRRPLALWSTTSLDFVFVPSRG
jgi:hypothetical protein